MRYWQSSTPWSVRPRDYTGYNPSAIPCAPRTTSAPCSRSWRRPGWLRPCVRPGCSTWAICWARNWWMCTSAQPKACASRAYGQWAMAWRPYRALPPWVDLDGAAAVVMAPTATPQAMDTAWAAPADMAARRSTGVPACRPVGAATPALWGEWPLRRRKPCSPSVSCARCWPVAATHLRGRGVHRWSRATLPPICSPRAWMRRAAAPAGMARPLAGSTPTSQCPKPWRTSPNSNVWWGASPKASQAMHPAAREHPAACTVSRMVVQPNHRPWRPRW